jgi:hypothetical protein
MPRADLTTWIDSTMTRFQTFQRGDVSIDGDRNPGSCAGCIPGTGSFFRRCGAPVPIDSSSDKSEPAINNGLERPCS